MSRRIQGHDFTAEVKSRYGVTTIEVRERLTGRPKTKKNMGTHGSTLGHPFNFSLHDGQIRFIEPEFTHQYRPPDDVIERALDFLESQRKMLSGAARDKEQQRASRNR